MLYKCAECDREIAEDASRCPYCGTKDAGERAVRRDMIRDMLAVQEERDRTDPGWRERERLAEQEKKVKRDRVKAVENKILLAFVMGGVLVGAALGFRETHGAFGLCVGAFTGCGVGGGVGAWLGEYLGPWLATRGDD